MPRPDRNLTPLTHPISQRLHEERTRGERLADTIADQVGSWRFIVIQTAAISLWISEHPRPDTRPDGGAASAD